jgi:hypothetical protein
MKTHLIKILLSTAVTICINLTVYARVYLVNSTTRVVRVDLSLNRNNLSIFGRNTTTLPYGIGEITGITAGAGFSGGGSSGSISLSANTVSTLWNANELQGSPISGTAPTAAGQLVKLNCTSGAPVPEETSTGSGSLWTQNGADIYFNTGNVGIGTISPDQKLTVKGKIHAKELIVDLSVPAPDYVFGKEYKLMSLEQLEMYIKQNRHLPEVPSAREMGMNSVNLSEMSMLILKKAEELSLYVIDHGKRIDKLEISSKLK